MEKSHSDNEPCGQRGEEQGLGIYMSGAYERKSLSKSAVRANLYTRRH